MYDVIVVGARVAGSPTAMLLARRGYRVLLVDRATFPSDTLSTHIVHSPGVAALQRWGLLDAVRASGCPPLETYSFDFGSFVLRGTPRSVDGVPAYAPRRTVLDAVLVEAAAAAGVEVRQGYNVDGLLFSDGRVVGIRHQGGTERARLVIGADGRNSHLAKAVGAASYHTRPKVQYAYYTYFSNLPVDGVENHIRPCRGFGAATTNDDLTMVIAGWPYAEAAAVKADVERHFLASLSLVPDFADRLATATREAPFLGGALPGYFRRPYGNGWALVGDAGYNKDPITAQGITDAFHDAERCADAVHAWLAEGASFEEVMSAWQAARDEAALPIYEFTMQLATLEPPPPETERLFGAMAGNAQAMDDFASVISGALSPVQFFAEDNIGRIIAAARPQVA
jgi:2-polyprenyl-6-methoxyphenol hydroxylase-like FAD-dependent oxidoreductase